MARVVMQWREVLVMVSPAQNVTVPVIELNGLAGEQRLAAVRAFKGLPELQEDAVEQTVYRVLPAYRFGHYVVYTPRDTFLISPA